MKLVVCSVFDSKADAYMQPFYSISRGSAIRSFMDAAQDEGHEFAKHAEDYTLFYLGEFDQQSGNFAMLEAHESMGNALEYSTKGLTAVAGGKRA